MAKRGKIVAPSTAAVGVVVAVIAGVLFKARLLEEWYLWRLEKGSEDERTIAAEKLGELQSVRAVAFFLDHVDCPQFGPNARVQIYYEALIRIGKPAVPGLLRKWKTSDPRSSTCFDALSQIYNVSKGPVTLVWDLLNDPSQPLEIRQLADAALGNASKFSCCLLLISASGSQSPLDH